MPLDLQLESEWHPTLNFPTNFNQITILTKNYWWIDNRCGHSYETSLSSKKRGYGCPYCSGKKILVGFNDLASNYPDIASQWHPTKNSPILSSQVSPGASSKKFWWICDKGHEWESKPLHRTNGSGCPFCSGHLPIVGENDLLTTHPELINKYWHPTKNLPHVPSDFKAGSSKKVWWICDKGHETLTLITNKITNNIGCKYCSNTALLVGFNDLASRNPELAAGWHPTLNGELTPDDVIFGSAQKVWWLCNKGHEWETGVGSRIRGAGCRVCSGNKIAVGFNDLASQNPELAAEWHPTLNGELTPENFTKTSGKKVWWLGKCGHEWEAVIANRTNGADCRECSYAIGAAKHSTPKIGVNDLLSQFPKVASELHPTKNGALLPETVHKGSVNSLWWQCVKGHEWETPVAYRTGKDKTNCPVCAPKIFVSRAEQELADFIVSLGVDVIQSDRKLLHGVELDVFIPSKMVAVEFNGLYWHRDQPGRSRYRHFDKWKLANDAGVQLLQVWEDDWVLRKDIVKRGLAHKLGLSAQLAVVYPDFVEHVRRVNGNQTSAVVLTTSVVQNFLNVNHVQGFVSGSYYLGLEDKDKVLRAVVVLRKEPGNVLNIVRYATFGVVMGGFTKLLRYVEREYSPTAFITFADRTISDGGLYENNGFVVDKELEPDYMYVVRGVRKHKFGYRLKRFRNDPELLWDESLSERELAILNNIPRIWDAGKIRYRLNVV